MELSTTQYKRCDLVKAIGRVDSNTAPDLEKAFNEILDNGKSGIVFDMAEVDFISSRGLWVLLETQKTCKKNKGKLVLVNVSEDMQQSLDGFFTQKVNRRGCDLILCRVFSGYGSKAFGEGNRTRGGCGSHGVHVHFACSYLDDRTGARGRP